MSPALAAAIAGLAALALGMGIGRFAYTPLLPALITENGLSIEAAGYIASANFAGYLAGALASLKVPARQRLTAFRVAIAASVVTTIAMGLPAPALVLAAIRFASGVASAFVMVHGSAVVLDVLALHRRPGLFPALYAGVGAGIAASALVVELAGRGGLSGAATWWALGAIAAVLALFAWRLAEPAHPASSTAAAVRGEAPPAGRHRALRLLLLAYGGLGFGYVITATFLVVMVRSRADWRAWEMAVWCVVGLAAAPSNWVWQRLSLRRGPWVAMIAAFLAEAVGVAAAGWGGHLAWVMLGALLLGGTFMAITALGLTTARQLGGGASGPLVARMTAAFGLGQILGPALGGWLAERTGAFQAPSALACAVLIVCAALLAVAARAERLSAASAGPRP